MDFNEYEYKATLVPIKTITNYFKEKKLNTDNFITADIGAFGGYTSYQLLEEINPKKHYVVDTYEFYEYWTHLKNFGTWKEKGGSLTNKDFNDVYLYAKDIFKDKTNVEVVKDYAEKFLNKFENNHFDFIFSGINIEPDSLTNIMNIVYKKVKKGGYISGYPYTSSSTYHKTVKALLEYTDVIKISKIKNNLFLLKKE